MSSDPVRLEVSDFRRPNGGAAEISAAERSRFYCEQLERGRVLFWRDFPFEFPGADLEFLLAQRPADSPFHKNVSYRPVQDRLRGSSAEGAERERLHRILRDFSRRIAAFAAEVLAPYARYWKLDYASFRPLEEQGRALPLHKRNDLVHVDSFPTRPTGGGRILRAFANISRDKPRVWLTGEPFPELAGKFARQADLETFARRRPNHALRQLASAFGVGGELHTRYDRFMLHFHDWLKENADWQRSSAHVRIEFPPRSAWIVFTDAVPHAVLSGQYAMEQTFIVPVSALVAPPCSPIRVLENLAGAKLS